MITAFRLWLVVPVVFLLLAVLAALPIPTRLALLSGLLLVVAVTFGLLAVYVARCPAPPRAPMQVVWVPMALGLAVYSIALWHMSQSWHVPSARVPVLVDASLVCGSILLAASVIQFLRATGRSRSAAS